VTHHLLKIEDEETEEEALYKWWERNGLNHEEARAKRQATYLEQLKAAAVAMDKYKHAHPTTNQD
jgi:hypothetical protein